LFYLNPSYWGSEADYGSGVFPRSEFERVAEILAGIEGRLILSINDVPELREFSRRSRIQSRTTIRPIPIRVPETPVA
jgi:DNA adenine methylase